MSAQKKTAPSRKASSKKKSKNAPAVAKPVQPSAGLAALDRALASPRPPAKSPTKPEVRRRAQRESLWPESPNLHFNRLSRRDVGFTTIPRSLSIACTIIGHIADVGASKVYYDLWCRSFDEGFVEITDERVLALSSGFKRGTRHVRTWQSKMRQLEKLGFILIRKRATSEFGYALLIHPHLALETIRADDTYSVPDHLWELFDERLREIGAQRMNVQSLADELAKAHAATKADRTKGSSGAR